MREDHGKLSDGNEPCQTCGHLIIRHSGGIECGPRYYSCNECDVATTKRRQITMPFMVVDVDTFPSGVTCSECRRIIEPGRPYTDRASGMQQDIPVVEIICVYC